MNFLEALKLAQQTGCKIRPVCWDTDCYLFIRESYLIDENGIEGNIEFFTFLEDWEVYQEPVKEKSLGEILEAIIDCNGEGGPDFWNSIAISFEAFIIEREKKKVEERDENIISSIIKEFGHGVNPESIKYKLRKVFQENF